MPTALAKPWPSGPVVTSIPGGVAGLGVSGRAAAPLAELAEVLEREVVAGQVQHGVLQDAGMPAGEDEAVAVRPVAGRAGRSA